MKAVGFKIWLSQSFDGVQYIIQNPDIKTIVLERENCLASFSSRLIAEQTRIYNLTENQGSESYRSPQISFDENRFLKYVDFYRKTFDFYRHSIESANKNHLWVTYSDNICLQKLKPVAGFLGVDEGLPMRGKTVKLNRQVNTIDRFADEDQAKVMKCLQDLGQESWAYGD